MSEEELRAVDVAHAADEGLVHQQLADGLGALRDAIEEIVEPYLMQQGFVQRTPRGRMLTSAVYGHIGLDAPATPPAQTNLPLDDE